MSIEFRLIDKFFEENLIFFFREISKNGDDKFFHPHPFSEKYTKKLVRYKGNDLYYIITELNLIVGYGYLRGWDKGYEIPSLGILIHSSKRGSGLGKLFLEFLHWIAKSKGAQKTMLKVYRENIIAHKLYTKMGYIFCKEENHQMIGYKDLI